MGTTISNMRSLWGQYSRGSVVITTWILDWSCWVWANFAAIQRVKAGEDQGWCRVREGNQESKKIFEKLLSSCEDGKRFTPVCPDSSEQEAVGRPWRGQWRSECYVQGLAYSLKLSYCLEKWVRRSSSDVDQGLEYQVEEILDFKNSLYLVKWVG